MGIAACIISLFFMVLSLVFDKKNKSISPNVVFFTLWSFILFLSTLNLYNIIKPSNESYLLIILMLIFFFLGSFLNKLIKKDIIKISFVKSKEENCEEIKPRFKLFYILSFFMILFNIIDFVIIIQQLLKGNPMWQIRNWTLEPFGSINPILSRRSFIEEVFRSIILVPFETIIPPIAAYNFFNSNNKKQRYTLTIISLIVLISSSLAGGGGRLGFIYYFGCFLLAFFMMYKDKDNNKEKIKKYKKITIIFLILGIIFVIACTVFRTGIGNLVKQVYTYFALPPSLLSIWLPKIKEVSHTYGMTTFFGLHSYFFRVFDTIGLDFLVPQIYHDTYVHITNAEIFKNVGYGVANAFVTPIYYFFIDGGYPFVCVASLLFGYIVSKFYKKFEQDINIRSFTIYSLIIYGVFLTFIRIQVAIPAYLISFIFTLFILRKCKRIEDDKEGVETLNYKKEINCDDLISIVIPIYNVEKYINKCIDSVINQTYANLEIILVDDGSPDKCGEICDEYAKKDKRIKVIHKENGGLSDARNAGIEIAKGKYITFIDSDDYVEECYTELLYNIIIANNADISIGSHKILYDKKSIDKSTDDKYCANSKLVLKKILYDDGIDLSTWGKLYKTELFNNVKFPKGRVFEDSATTYKLVDLSNKIAVYSEPLYNYVMRNDSISKNEFSEKKLDLIISTKEMTDYIRNKYPDLIKACDRRLMYAYLSTLTQLSKSKNTNKKIEEELLKYIKENRKNILIDKKVPKRDKVGIYSSIFGLKIYGKIWNLYSKFTGRK